MLYMKEIELAAKLIHSANIDELMDCMSESSALVDNVDAPPGTVDSVSTSGLEPGQGRPLHGPEPERTYEPSSSAELQR